MKSKEKTIRLTIDVQTELHKRLKIESAMVEKSMRDIVIEAIEEKVQSLDTKNTQ